MIPLAAIPLLPAIGLGAVGAALATPLAWVGVALAGRSVVHAIQGRARKIAMKNDSAARGRDVPYSELYPTQENVRGLFNTYIYNRTLKRTAGKTFTELEEMKEFKDFEGTQITPQQQTQQQTQQQDQNQNQNTNNLVDDFIKDITNLNIEDKNAIEAMRRRVGLVIPHATGDKRDFVELGIKYLNVAASLHENNFMVTTQQGTSLEPRFEADFRSLVTEDPNKSKEYNEFREKLSENLKNLCVKLGYTQVVDNFYGPQQQTQQQTQQQRQQQPGPGGQGGNGGNNGNNGGNPPSGNGGNNQPPANNDQETYARTPELQKLVFMLREFDTSKMTMENYNKANKLLAKVDGAYRVHRNDFYLDPDDELTLAEVRSMAEAYEAKTALVDKLKVCEASIAAGAFYQEAFEDCISEFYNMVGHTTYVSEGKKSTSVRTATSRNLLSREEYERVKKVLQYYKKYSALTNKSGFADEQVQFEESAGRRR